MSGLRRDCPLCRSAEVELFFESGLGWAVRSDWKPVAASVSIFRCGRCSHLFKDPETVKALSDYEGYTAFENLPQSDKVDFTQGNPISRSASILEFLRKKAVLTDRTRVLDYGCNRGAFLALLSNARRAGFDVSEQYRPILEGLGCSYHTPKDPPPAAAFDLLTLIQVAEHLEDIPRNMKAGIDALVEGGSILIQVPDPFNQPTDLYIVDHFSHFTVPTLDLAMASAGLENIEPVSRLLGGELTGLYRKSVRPAQPTALRADESGFRALKESLIAGEETLHSLKRKGDSCLIFGAGLLGSLVVSYLGKQAVGFIDDNSALTGKKMMGLPIRTLDDAAPGEHAVVVAVPPSAARRVLAKCQARGLRVEAPYVLAQ